MIKEFRGDYYFLSNFYDSRAFEYNGITYTSGESAFQAQKSLDERFRQDIAIDTPNIAKSKGRRVKLRSDWEQVKDNIMYEIVKAKFNQNPDILRKLLNTGDELLEEGNTWHDNYWGVCQCVKCQDKIGHNHLGKILMIIRQEFRGEKHS